MIASSVCNGLVLTTSLGQLPTLVNARFLEDNHSHSAVQGMEAGDPQGGQKLPFKGTDCRAKALSPLASQTQHGWGAV